MFARLYENVYAKAIGQYRNIKLSDYVALIRGGSVVPNADENTVKAQQPACTFYNDNNEVIAVAIDYDHLHPDMLRAIPSQVAKIGYQCFIHTTSSSTPEAPRVRLIFPVHPTKKAIDYDATFRKLGLPDTWDKRAVGSSRMWYVPTLTKSKIQMQVFTGSRLNPEIKSGAGEAYSNWYLSRLEDKQVGHLSQLIADSAAPYLTHTIDAFTKQLQKLGVGDVKFWQAGANVVVESTCPKCSRRTLSSNIGIANGSWRSNCFRATCNFTHVGTLPPNDMRFQWASFMDNFASKFERKAVHNTNLSFWEIGDLRLSIPAVQSLLADHLHVNTQSLYYHAMRIQPTLTLRYKHVLPELTDSMVESCSLQMQTIPVSLAHENLHVLSSTYIEHLQDVFKTPYNGNVVTPMQMRLPNHLVNGVQTTALPDGPASYRLRLLGYEIVPPRSLFNMMHKLTPVVVMPLPTPRPGTEDLQSIWFQQRVFIALHRGCKVLVPLQATGNNARNLMARFGLHRSCLSTRDALPLATWSLPEGDGKATELRQANTAETDLPRAIT